MSEKLTPDQMLARLVAENVAEQVKSAKGKARYGLAEILGIDGFWEREVRRFEVARKRWVWGDVPPPVHGWYVQKHYTTLRNLKTWEWEPMDRWCGDVMPGFCFECGGTPMEHAENNRRAATREANRTLADRLVAFLKRLVERLKDAIL
jgi:hypothetical protein